MKKEFYRVNANRKIGYGYKLPTGNWIIKTVDGISEYSEHHLVIYQLLKIGDFKND